MNSFDLKGLKAQARRLQSAVTDLVGTPVRLSTAYELVARTHGFRNWDTAAKAAPAGASCELGQEPTRKLHVRRAKPAMGGSPADMPPWVLACCEALSISRVPLVLVSGNTGSGRTTVLEQLVHAVASTRVASSSADRLTGLVVSQESSVTVGEAEALAQSLMRTNGADLIGIDVSENLIPAMAPDFLNCGFSVAVVVHASSAALALVRFNSLAGTRFTVPDYVPVLSVHCERRPGREPEIDWQWLQDGATN